MNRERSRLVAYLYQFDYLLMLFVLLTTGLGLLVLEGATGGVAGLEDKVPRQIVWWGVSLMVFFVAVLVPYPWLRALGWPLYVALIALLVLLLAAARGQAGFLTGITAGGAASWFEVSLAGRPIRFQPSEFTKIAVVIVVAHWLAWRRRHLGNLLEAIPPLILTIVPFFIICKQPDFGTAAVFLPLPFILLFVAGLPWRVVLSATALGLLAMAGGFYYLANTESVPGLSGYKAGRIEIYLDPIRGMFKPPGIEDVLYGGAPAGETPRTRASDQGNLNRNVTPASRRQPSRYEWSVWYAEMALGSGKIMGKGWKKEESLSRLRFIPEYWTDFIFSALGEQFGLVGCLSLLGLYLLIAWRAVHIAVAGPDPFGKYLVVGLLSVVLIHVFINVSMQIRLLPVTGLPLPLVSYGGSFLVTNYLIFGLIANVGMRRRSVQLPAFSPFIAAR